MDFIQLQCVIDSAGGGNNDIQSTKNLQKVIQNTVSELQNNESLNTKSDEEICKLGTCQK